MTQPNLSCYPTESKFTNVIPVFLFEDKALFTSYLVPAGMFTTLIGMVPKTIIQRKVFLETWKRR